MTLKHAMEQETVNCQLSVFRKSRLTLISFIRIQFFPVYTLSSVLIVIAIVSKRHESLKYEWLNFSPFLKRKSRTGGTKNVAVMFAETCPHLGKI